MQQCWVHGSMQASFALITAAGNDACTLVDLHMPGRLAAQVAVDNVLEGAYTYGGEWACCYSKQPVAVP